MSMKESYDQAREDYWIDKNLDDYAKQATAAFNSIIAQKNLADAFANAIGYAYINDDIDAITIADALNLNEGNFFALHKNRSAFHDFLLTRSVEAHYE